MAKLHNQLDRGNWSDAIKSALGVSKSLGAIERYGETLTPVLNLWEQPEWALLRGEVLLGDAMAQAAVAAQNTVFRLLNPVGSGIVAVVEEVRASTTATETWQLGIQVNQANLATLSANGPVHRDPRRGVVSIVGRCRMSSTTNIANVGLIALNNTLGQTPFLYTLPIILTPGVSLTLTTVGVNVTVFGSFNWREHQALPGELV